MEGIDQDPFDIEAALAAPTHGLRPSESGTYSNNSTPSMQQHSHLLGSLANAGVPNAIRMIGDGVVGAAAGIANLASQALPSLRKGTAALLNLVRYDTNSELFDEWTSQPEADHVSFEQHYDSKKKKLVDEINTLESGSHDETHKIYSLNMHKNNLTAAREMTKQAIKTSETAKAEMDDASRTKRDKLLELETKHLILTDMKTGKCQIYRDMAPAKILEKEGLVTDLDWKKKGQSGLPAFARKVFNLGYLNNKDCPVNAIAKDRRIISGSKESTIEYMKYLQQVFHYKPDAVRAALLEEEEPKIKALVEAGLMKPGASASRKRKVLNLLAKDDTDVSDGEDSVADEGTLRGAPKARPSAL